ncbi:hypothetical protein PR048_026906 [Dryococelus australis]|uniref:Uncharacterized protein n=1 Tax=Dryococelus australis TaxID=614101 RepID=A0ABQ9GMM4_9NEOP|nr:hypothetical protein PR048_026906 [Dryococelus australis]
MRRGNAGGGGGSCVTSPGGYEGRLVSTQAPCLMRFIISGAAAPPPSLSSRRYTRATAPRKFIVLLGRGRPERSISSVTRRPALTWPGASTERASGRGETAHLHCVRHPDFCIWELFHLIPLVGGFSRGSPVSPTPSIQRCSIVTFITLIISLTHLAGWSQLSVVLLMALLAQTTHWSAQLALLWLTAATAANSHTLNVLCTRSSLHEYECHTRYLADAALSSSKGCWLRQPEDPRPRSRGAWRGSHPASQGVASSPGMQWRLRALVKGRGTRENATVPSACIVLLLDCPEERRLQGLLQHALQVRHRPYAQDSELAFCVLVELGLPTELSAANLSYNCSKVCSEVQHRFLKITDGSMVCVAGGRQRNIAILCCVVNTALCVSSTSYLELLEAREVRGSKGDTATCMKCVIASTRKAAFSPRHVIVLSSIHKVCKSILNVVDGEPMRVEQGGNGAAPKCLKGGEGTGYPRENSTTCDIVRQDCHIVERFSKFGSTYSGVGARCRLPPLCVVTCPSSWIHVTLTYDFALLRVLECGALSSWCNIPGLVELSLHEAEEYPGSIILAELQKMLKMPSTYYRVSPTTKVHSVWHCISSIKQTGSDAVRNEDIEMSFVLLKKIMSQMSQLILQSSRNTPVLCGGGHCPTGQATMLTAPRLGTDNYAVWGRELSSWPSIHVDSTKTGQRYLRCVGSCIVLLAK